MRVPRTHATPAHDPVIDQDTSHEVDRSGRRLPVQQPTEFRITGITPFGLLGDASGVRGLLADLRGEILAVQAGSVAPVSTLTPGTDAASDGTSFRDRRRSRLAIADGKSFLQQRLPATLSSSTRSPQRIVLSPTSTGSSNQRRRTPVEPLHYIVGSIDAPHAEQVRAGRT